MGLEKRESRPDHISTEKQTKPNASFPNPGSIDAAINFFAYRSVKRNQLTTARSPRSMDRQCYFWLHDLGRGMSVAPYNRVTDSETRRHDRKTD